MARTVPFNLEAEQSIIGCVLIDNNLIITLADEVKAEDFYDRRHQLIYTSMLDLTRKQIQIDYTTLIAELQMKNKLQEAGGVSYLSEIMDAVYTTANFTDYIRIIKDTAMKRNVISAANSISEAGFDPAYDATTYFDYATKLIEDLSRNRRTEGFRDIRDVLNVVHGQTLQARNNTDDLTGLRSGFDNLDELTNGLQPHALIIIAARPAMGKSAFAMNLATQVSRFNMKENGEHAHVAVFSLEMSAEQITQRLIACQANIKLGNIIKGDMSQQEMMMFEAANTELGKLNIHFCDQAVLTVSDIRARCRKQKAETGLDLVIIDYLQLISGEGNGKSNRQEEVSHISRSLKQMARELEIPVIALAQLSREVEKREDKHPQMADLRESGSIEQDADLIGFLYRGEYYTRPEGKQTGVTELNIAKNRSGMTTTLNYIFQGEYQRFRTFTPSEE